MKVKIKGKEIELHYGPRMYLKYEERTKKSVSFEGLSSFTGIIELLYCAITGTLEHRKYKDLNITLTWEEFLDWLDDQNPNGIMSEFNEWLMNIMQAQSDSTSKDKEEVEERDPNS